MVMAEQTQVWVGSEDSVIYIINVHSMSCNKQLTDHRSSVTGLVVQDRAQAPRSGQAPLGGGAVWLLRGSGVPEGRVPMAVGHGLQGPGSAGEAKRVWKVSRGHSYVVWP